MATITAHSAQGETAAEQSGTILSLSPLAVPCPMHPRTWWALLAASTAGMELGGDKNRCSRSCKEVITEANNMH